MTLSHQSYKMKKIKTNKIEFIEFHKKMEE